MPRLHGPVTKLMKTNGRVAIGIFEDGTIIVAGPEDRPMLFRNGGMMAPEHYEAGAKGDVEFRYVDYPEEDCREGQPVAAPK
jgi:hypothetical protein